jgi:hypothetical protein
MQRREDGAGAAPQRQSFAEAQGRLNAARE